MENPEKFEKLKRYNQKILAILGSLAILFLVIVIISTLSILAKEFHYWTRSEIDREIVSNEVAEENINQNKRTHQIHFESVYLIDTANLVYVIPVSQTALDMIEYVAKRDRESKGKMGLMSLYNDSYYYGYEAYNNILVYSQQHELPRQLFTKRVSINQISFHKIDKKTYLFMVVTDDDTGKDGKLNEQDLKTLYIYSTEDDSLFELKYANTNFVDYQVLGGSGELLVRFGLDKNNDGTYNYHEPAIFMKYSLTERKLKSFINDEMMQNLQDLLDGNL